MKNPLICGIFILVIGLLAPQIAPAQGSVTFLSNVGEPSAGSTAVGSDSWLAAGFMTGANASGYVINSIQLSMANGSGSPGGFSVSIYDGNQPGAVLPFNNLGTLSGSADPATAGSYTFTSSSSLTLSPSAYYFIVLTSGKTVAQGAYEWNFLNTAAYSPADGWGASVSYGSGNGSSWTRLGSNPNYDYSQFAINATPAPEPGVLGLFALGGLLIGFRRCKARPV